MERFALHFLTDGRQRNSVRILAAARDTVAVAMAVAVAGRPDLIEITRLGSAGGISARSENNYSNIAS